MNILPSQLGEAVLKITERQEVEIPDNHYLGLSVYATNEGPIIRFVYQPPSNIRVWTLLMFEIGSVLPDKSMRYIGTFRPKTSEHMMIFIESPEIRPEISRVGSVWRHNRKWERIGNPTPFWLQPMRRSRCTHPRTGDMTDLA